MLHSPGAGQSTLGILVSDSNGKFLFKSCDVVSLTDLRSDDRSRCLKSKRLWVFVLSVKEFLVCCLELENERDV